MANTREDENGLPDTGSETEVLNGTADNLSGNDLAQFLDRRAELEEALLYEDNVNSPVLLSAPTFAQRQAIKEKLSQEEDQQRKERETEEEKRRQEALSLEKYQTAMDGIITQEKDLLAQTASMQSQVERLKIQLDERTLKVNGQRVYRQGDHFVDENGNRVSDDVEKDADRQLKDHPDAATWDQKTKVDEAERRVKEATADIQRHAETAQNNRDNGPSQTPDQRKRNREQAGSDLDHDQGAVGIAGKAVGDADKSFAAGGAGFTGMVHGADPGDAGPTPGSVSGTSSVLPQIDFVHDKASVEPAGKATTLAGLQSVVSVDATTHTTSFTGGILPIEGKGDLTKEFQGPTSGNVTAVVVTPAQIVAARVDGAPAGGSLKTGSSPPVIAGTEASIKEKGELAAYFHGLASGQNIVPTPSPTIVADASGQKDKDEDPLTHEFSVASVGAENKDSVPDPHATTSPSIPAARPQTANA